MCINACLHVNTCSIGVDTFSVAVKNESTSDYTDHDYSCIETATTALCEPIGDPLHLHRCVLSVVGKEGLLSQPLNMECCVLMHLCSARWALSGFHKEKYQISESLQYQFISFE